MPTQTAVTGIEETLHAIAKSLGDEIDSLVESMLGRMRDEAPDFDLTSRPELDDGLRASCYGNIRAALGALGGDRQVPRVAPAEALAEARATARTDVGLEPLLHTYRIGHAVVLERFFVLMEDLKLPARQRSSATLVGSKYLFSYVDRVVGQVSVEYSEERQRVLRSSIQRRVQLVRDVLGGVSVDSVELGYRLEQEHIAIVAAGPAADASLRDLARRSGRQLLTVAMTDHMVWGWLGAARPSAPGAVATLLEEDRAPHTSYALGEPAWGIGGFRISHEQALAANRVAAQTIRKVTTYDEVALEATLLGDVRAARRFAQRELGPLASPDRRLSALRDTLGCYLQSGLNAAATSAVLHISDRTVAYRLRAVEDLLGRGVVARSCELAAAVRLYRILNE